MKMDLSQVAFRKPEKYQTFDIKCSNGNVLVIREPFAYDFATIAEIKKKYPDNSHYAYLAIGLYLAESFNGERGVNPIDVGSLDRFAYKQLMETLQKFELDIIPDYAKSMLPEIARSMFNIDDSRGEAINPFDGELM